MKDSVTQNWGHEREREVEYLEARSIGKNITIKTSLMNKTKK